MKLYIVVIFFFLFALNSVFAGEAEIVHDQAVSILTPMQIADVISDPNNLGDWLTKFFDTLNNELEKDTQNRDLIFLVTLHPGYKSTFQLSARPAYNKKQKEKILERINKIKCPEILYTDLVFSYEAKINKGCENENLEYEPALKNPYEKEYENFLQASLADKSRLLSKWATEEVIPILGTVAANVDPKFEGVRSFGGLLLSTDFNSNPDISALTEKNPDYRRAIVEMAPDDQLITTAKVFMHVAVGQFDMSRNYLQMISPFTSSETVAYPFQLELISKFENFYTVLNRKIDIGIKLHDQGEYQKAMDVYDEIIKEYPQSATAHYEQFIAAYCLSQNIEPGMNFAVTRVNKDSEIDNAQEKKIAELWDSYSEKIFTANPIFSRYFRADSGEQAWLVFRRMEIDDLFSDQDKFKSDLIKYADIALDLEQYGFAFHLYWLVSHIQTDEQGLKKYIARFLYCADKLGDKMIIKNFKGDFKTDFEDIEKEKLKRMKESDIYKAFVE